MAPRCACSPPWRPSDGDLVQAPLNQWRMPVDVIGVAVPVLDEQTEMFWWDTANYVSGSLPPRWHHGGPWPHADARTLPGYPTFSRTFPSRAGSSPPTRPTR